MVQDGQTIAVNHSPMHLICYFLSSVGLLRIFADEELGALGHLHGYTSCHKKPSPQPDY